jgi:hypothetical protein
VPIETVFRCIQSSESCFEIMKERGKVEQDMIHKAADSDKEVAQDAGRVAHSKPFTTSQKAAERTETSRLEGFRAYHLPQESKTDEENLPASMELWKSQTIDDNIFCALDENVDAKRPFPNLRISLNDIHSRAEASIASSSPRNASSLSCETDPQSANLLKLQIAIGESNSSQRTGSGFKKR